MSVARVVEISATSPKSFEDAIVQGIARASETLRDVKSAWVKEQEAKSEGRKGHRLQGQLEGHLRPRWTRGLIGGT